MKQHIFLAGIVLFLTGCASYTQQAQVALWPGVAPGSEGQSGPEVTREETTAAAGVKGTLSFLVTEHVNSPSITPFIPEKCKATGAAVIILPGGGHKFLAIDHEGWAVAKALADRGVAAFVLKYRLAKEANSPYKVEVHELMDVQRAIRLVRSQAGEWGVDPNRVGIMGFSAGGELAVLAATKFATPVQGTSDAVDALDCRPDFAALMYPGGLTDPAAVKIPANMPPAYLSCAYNDRATISVSLAQFYLSLKQAGVPAELHIYNSGGHGFGVRPGNKPVNHWINLFMDWMGDRGLLHKAE